MTPVKGFRLNQSATISRKKMCDFKLLGFGNDIQDTIFIYKYIFIYKVRIGDVQRCYLNYFVPQEV